MRINDLGKWCRYVFIVALLVCGSTVLAVGQTFPTAKIAVIDVDEFANPKSGITRLVIAIGGIDKEMKPRRDDIAQFVASHDKLAKEVNDTKDLAEKTTIAAKVAQLDKMRADIETKQREGQTLLDRRMHEVTQPIYADIMQALDTFVKKRSIDMVIDLSKIGGSVMVANNAFDITTAFIAEYNAKPAVP